MPIQLRFRPLSTTLLLAALVALSPTRALAGACPTCTTSAECEALFPDDPAFCVLHDGDVGCGSERQICCPGQGCNTFSGRPSCEAAGTCVVVDGATDAGTTPGTDAGTTPGTDAGTTPGTDAGTTPGVDAGTIAMDGGSTPGTDAGPPVDEGSSGCGCRVGGGGASHGSLALGAAIVLGIALRRRRAR